MAEYQLTQKADDDLTEIYIFTYQQFGETQADAYLLGMEERFLELAAQPALGRKVDHVRKGYYRSEYARHSIFYKIMKGGIRVIRVLHHKMDSERHL